MRNERKETALRGVEDIRSSIDETDRSIVELLSKRLELVTEMAQAKGKIGRAVFDPARADAVLQSARNRAAELGGDPEVVGAIYQALLQSFLTFEETKHSALSAN